MTKWVEVLFCVRRLNDEACADPIESLEKALNSPRLLRSASDKMRAHLEFVHFAGVVTEVTDYIELFLFRKVEGVYIMPSPLSLAEGAGTIALPEKGLPSGFKSRPYCFS